MLIKSNEEELSVLKELFDKGCTVNKVLSLMNNDNIKFEYLLNLASKQYNIIYSDDRVYFAKKIDIKVQKYNINLKNNKYIFISDTHLGNKDDRLDLLEYVYEYAYKHNIKVIIHLGDLVDGFYEKKGSIFKKNLRIKDPNMQIENVIKNYPNSKGILTLFITGNHDQSLYDLHNLDVGKIVSKERPDLTYLGYGAANIMLNEISMFLYHGNHDYEIFDNHNIFKVSKELNPYNYNIIARGHSHRLAYHKYDDTHCLQVPTLSDVIPFSEKTFESPIVGFNSVELTLDKQNLYQINNYVRTFKRK